MLFGDRLFSEEALAQQVTPVKTLQLVEKTGEKVKSGDDEKQVGKNPEKEIFRTLERMLNGRGGESLVLENALKHIHALKIHQELTMRALLQTQNRVLPR